MTLALRTLSLNQSWWLIAIWLPILLFPVGLRAQDNGCTGSAYVQLLRDEADRDVRLTCVLPYPGGSGDVLIGGMADGHILLMRMDREGNLRWRRSIVTQSESTELSTLNQLAFDTQGMLTGVGSTFNNNFQRAYHFRYDPTGDRLLYFNQPDFPSEATAIQITSEGHYLLFGARLSLPSPFFNRLYVQRVDPLDGQPSSEGEFLDLGGEERILDVHPHDNGDYTIAGEYSLSLGAGAKRAGMSRLTADGKVINTIVGSVTNDRNARLFAFDVEVIGDKTFLLQWGNIDNITGAINTSIILTRFSSNGEADWTRLYNILDFEGENAVELQRNGDDLLLSGFSLIGKRDLFLLQLNQEGEVQWAKSYPFGGRAQVYLRANQQLLVTNESILALATLSFSDERSSESVILQVDRDGNSPNECLEVNNLSVRREPIANVWREVRLTAETANVVWAPQAAFRRPPTIVAYDDCDVPCERCADGSFQTVAICEGDSLSIAGAFRRESGIFVDTLPGLSPEGCDTLVQTELRVSDGPTASFTERRYCGLANIDVSVLARGGVPPYTYQWSDPEVEGPQVSLPSGDYRVTVSDLAACNPFVLAITLADNPDNQLTYFPVSPSCPGANDGGIRLEPSGLGAVKLLGGGDFQEDGITGLTAGTHGFILRTSLGCEVYREVTIPAAPPFSVTIQGPQRIRLGDRVDLEVTVFGPSTISTYDWTANVPLECSDCPIVRLQPTTDTLIYLRTLSSAGCEAFDSLEIIVIEGPPRLYLPTAFSPNGDDLNDEWIPGIGPDVAEISAWQVYDRWGNLVWTFDSGTANYWDGRISSSGLAGSTGSYVYTLQGLSLNGKPFSRQGTVTLIR